MTPECAAKSLAWLSHPDEWLAWPACPVVRRDGKTPTHGIVRANDWNTVYVINLFMLESGLLDKQLAGVERLIYPGGLRAMIADGWEVD